MNRLHSVIRLTLLPIGLLNRLGMIAKEGSRDIYNRYRYKEVKIDSGCSINEKTEIKRHVHILSNSTLNNVVIDSYSYIGRNCLVQNAQIGKFCSIANDVFIGLGTHPIHLLSTSTLFYRVRNTLGIKLVEKDLNFDEYQKITIGNDVWIGARAILMDGISVGDGAIIAANAVVTKDIPPYAIVGGVPAKVLKYRFEEEQIKKLVQSKWWEQSIKEIKQQIVKKNDFI